MADKYSLAGSYSTTPALGNPSGQPSLEAPIQESVSLIKKSEQEYTLDADAPVTVSLGGLTQAQVLNIKAVGGKVRVRLTSADGAQQAIPVDGFLSLICLTVPITAIDLTRVAGTETIVTVFLGQTS